MKRIIIVFLFVLFLTTLSSCIEIDNDTDNNNTGEEMGNIINIYTLNDFHGAIFEDKNTNEIGISKIGAFLKSEKTKNPNNTVILSAGDMFQGTAVSSLTKGRVIVDLMNYLEFDAMAIGNHEFDWGVSEITKFVDNNDENGESDFPFLGANIYNKVSSDYVDWAKPYTVIDRGNIKIGILGLIGEELTSSIIGSISKDFEFTSQMDAIKKYVPILRNQEGADIVIINSHDDTKGLNDQIKNLEGEFYVDAVLNGHTHNYYVFEETRGDKPPLIGVQSGSNGKYIGQLSLELDLENKKVIDAYANFVDTDELNYTSTEVESIINNYQDYLDIANETLGQAGTYINQYDGTSWAVNTIGLFDSVDLGIINAGGVRSAGFPIRTGSVVTYGSIFKMMPFDNKVITLELTGSQIMQLVARGGDLRYSQSLNTSSRTINGVIIEDNKLYKVAVIDFVFYRYDYIFMQGENIVHHDVIFRDLLVEQVKQTVASTGKWYI